MKRKLYYVISPQLEEIDGIYETNGWRDVSVYDIFDNKPTEICDLTIHNESNSIDCIKDRLSELLVDVDNVELIQL